MNYKMKVELTSPDGQVIVTDKVTPVVGRCQRIKRDMDVVKEWWEGKSIDLIVVADGELHHFQRCISVLAERTSEWCNCKMIVVNDYDFNSDFMQRMIFESSFISMLVHYVDISSLKAVDNTIKENTWGNWIVIVDQNVVVTEGWLDRIIATIHANRNAAMVVPWSSKRIPPEMGGNYVETAERISRTVSIANHMVALPGLFCLAIEREAFEEAGGFLDESVANLYMRMSRNGRIAIRADDCYVKDSTKGVSEVGKWLLDPVDYMKFINEWGKDSYDAYEIRAGRDMADETVVMMMKEKTDRKKVVFVMREAPICGMVLAIVHICNELIELGWDASFACTKLENAHKKLMPMRFTPYVFRDDVEMIDTLQKLSDANIIATIWSTAKTVKKICDNKNNLVPAYFVQDDERKFRHSSGELYAKPKDVEATYGMFKNVVVNSDWVLEEMQKLGYAGEKIGIGVDTLMFHPEEKSNGRVRIMAHCRPSTPRRGWSFIAAVINQVFKNGNVEFVTYDEEPEGLYVRNHRHLGKISPEQLAMEMNHTHIFLEGSERQGWGMQALEAMASGCALVCTDNYGIHNFGTDGYDCVIVPYADVENTVRVINRLVGDVKEREALAKSARETAEHFNWPVIGSAWDRFLKNTR